MLSWTKKTVRAVQVVTPTHTIRITTLAIDIGSVRRGFTARLRLKIDCREATSGARKTGGALTPFEPVD